MSVPRPLRSICLLLTQRFIVPFNKIQTIYTFRHAMCKCNATVSLCPRNGESFPNISICQVWLPQKLLASSGLKKKISLTVLSWKKLGLLDNWSDTWAKCYAGEGEDLRDPKESFGAFWQEDTVAMMIKTMLKVSPNHNSCLQTKWCWKTCVIWGLTLIPLETFFLCKKHNEQDKSNAERLTS